MQVRLFSLDEANALVPMLEERMAQARAILRQLTDLREQLVDLHIVWGDAVEDPTCDGHAEHERFRAAFITKERELQAGIEAMTALGCEVRDVENGLVDFHARRGDDVVLLCWRAGEPRITAWHSQTTGFTGRRPVEEF
jgi:hypothetical protein